MRFFFYMNDIEGYVRQQKELINKALDDNLQRAFSSKYELDQAAIYTVDPKGSMGHRYRSIFGLEIYQMLGGEQSNFLKGVVGLEFIHHASLIIDDLPCMDNSDTRKKKETTHVVYGESIARLASFYLYNEGRRLIRKNTRKHLDDNEEVVELIDTMMYQMFQGQEIDLRKEKSDEELSDSMHKKNILFHLASVLPAYLLKKEEKLDYLNKIGSSASIGYQFFDDLRDVKSNPGITGKPVGVDSKKNTSVYKWGKDVVIKRLGENKEIIIENLRKIQPNSKLEQIIEYMLE